MPIGFIGVGKITSAVIEGLCTSLMEKTQIFLSPRNEANGRLLTEKYKQVERLDANQQVIDRSEIVFIAVRPAVAMEVLQSLAFRENQLVISLVPLLKKSELLTAVHPATKVVRAVPTPAVMQHTGPIILFNSNDTVTQLFRHLGQPVEVANEQQLHALWTLTGLITPFYDLLDELSRWTISNGVDPVTASEYVTSMFQALAFAAAQNKPINFKELARHAETPNGMNEQAGKEIREKGAHLAWGIASDNLLRRFE
jgi:pyrroline-5-carboxylate reductase